MLFRDYFNRKISFAGTIQGLHNIHGSFNVPPMQGTLASRNSTINNVPTGGVQQPTGSLSSGRFASNNLTVALSQVLVIYSLMVDVTFVITVCALCFRCVCAFCNILFCAYFVSISFCSYLMEAPMVIQESQTEEV